MPVFDPRLLGVELRLSPQALGSTKIGSSTIPLMARVARWVTDKKVLKLIRSYLEVGVDDLDRMLAKRGRRFVRYADDITIYVSAFAATCLACSHLYHGDLHPRAVAHGRATKKGPGKCPAPLIGESNRC